jgi:hypothetical protein
VLNEKQIEQEIHVEPALLSKDGWALMRGKQLFTTSTDQGKVIEVCNIMRGHECFECRVGAACCFYPKKAA